MGDLAVTDPITPNPDLPTRTEFEYSLPIPPLDPTIFSDDLTLPDNFLSFDDEDFDITFDDLYLPSDTEDFLRSTFTCSNPIHLSSESEPGGCVNEAVSDPESGGAKVSSCQSPESGQISGDRASDVVGFLNFPSQDSGEFIKDYAQESGNEGATVPRVLNCPSPESENHNPVSSQGSGNCGSAGSETLNYKSPDSGNYSHYNSINEVVDQKIKLEELGNNCLLKRKKANGDVNSESRTNKYRRSNGMDIAIGLNEVDDKKKARLIRNRESAHLSRQRKKHYVEELEDKVRAMHSTIQDLNAKISYIVTENASLRQQMAGGGATPVMYPHPPMAPMPYPWIPCPPPYVVKPQGSQVPLVPIPRLKPQQPVSASKAKKVEIKKGQGKTKKVASVSFLGLLAFVMLFGVLVPMVNVKYRGMHDTYSGGSTDYVGNRFYDHHCGRVLIVNSVNETNHNIGTGFYHEKSGAGSGRRSHLGEEPNIELNEQRPHSLPGSDESVHPGNASEPLIASLYVPRNDKLVKIDGNLIIHSVLASEKAMASRQEPGMRSNKETGLAVALDLAPAISVPGLGRNNGIHPHLYRSSTERQRALASEKESLKSKAADGKLQQWFREGLAGPLLSSGMCTEVFQFDVSAASASAAIVQATSVRNITAEHRQNSTHLNNKGRNRRILHGLPIPLPAGLSDNITKHRVGSNNCSNKESPHENNSLSSMVVSVLVDPREAGDGDGDGDAGLMGTKSFSRIFVVVLLDSVKYVTYSCMLPLKGSSHLVTT